MANDAPEADNLPEDEVKRRAEATLRRMLETPSSKKRKVRLETPMKEPSKKAPQTVTAEKS